MVNSRFNRRQVLSTVGASIVASMGLSGQAAASSDGDKLRTYSAELTGDQQVPPVETDATGHAVFEVSEDGTQVAYAVHVESICNVTQAHIQLGEEGEIGPVIVWLYPEDVQKPELIEGRFEGALSVGTITEDDLVGPLEGASFEEAAGALESESAYVNFHTEQHPDGEIRGQIIPDEEPPEKEPEEPPERDEPEEPEDPPGDSDGPGEPEDPEDPEQPPEDGDDPEEPETHTLTVSAGEAIGVEGATITVEGQTNNFEETRTTDASGDVAFAVPDGQYTVTGVDPNGREDTSTVVVDGEDTEVLLGGLAPPRPEVYTLTVQVIDAETGDPIEGAVVTGVGGFHPLTGDMLFQATTGVDGTASTDVNASEYIVDVQAAGYEIAQQINLTVDSDTELTIGLEPEDSE